MLNQTKYGLFILALTACCAMVACDNQDDNDNCTVKGCEAGYKCNDQTAKCIKLLEKGESCVDSSLCDGDLICGKDRVCTDASQGQGIKGDPCTSADECAVGLICKEDVCQEKQSAADPYAGQRGAKCDAKEDCAGNLECIQHICTKHTGIKAYCNDSENILCNDPLVCDDNICKEVMPVDGLCTDMLGTLCPEGSRCLVVSGSTRKCISNDNPNFKDSDGDTIMDFYEICDKNDTNCKADFDEDTIPNYLDLDSDGDTIPDSVEAGNIQMGDEPAFAMDGESFAFLNLDSDLNGIPDADEGCPKFLGNIDCGLTEMPVGKDKTETFMAITKPYSSMNGVLPDYLSFDNDMDTRNDVDEIKGLIANRNMRCANESENCPAPGTADNPVDSDGDTLPDYMSVDSDGDGILDITEGPSDSDVDNLADVYSLDSDGDGILDADEVEMIYVTVKNHDNVDTIKALRVQYSGSQNSTTLHKDNRGNTIVRDDGYITEDIVTKGNLLLMNSEGELLTVIPDSESPDITYYLAIELDGYLHAVSESGMIYQEDDLIPLYTYDGERLKDANGNPLFKNSDKEIGTVNSTDGSFVVVDKTEKRIEQGHSKPLRFVGQEVSNYCFQAGDCDNDGLSDNDEVLCKANEYPGTIRETIHSMTLSDVDGDGASDVEEFYAFTIASGKLVTDYSEACPYDNPDEHKDECTCLPSTLNNGAESCYKTFTVSRAEDLICSQGLSNKDFPGLAFTLDGKGEVGQAKSAPLFFKPAVSKLDLVFNLDVTGSMGKEVENLQSTLQDVVIRGVRESVEDSAFGISEFGDIPIYHKDKNGTPKYGRPDSHEINGGQYFKKDSPWTLHIRPEKNPGLLTEAVNKYSLSDGGDFPESGYESLWMLAKGDESVTDANRLQYKKQNLTSEGKPGEITSEWVLFEAQGQSQGADRWGGAGFRTGTLPVVVHITDALSHGDGNAVNDYDDNFVLNAHNADAVHQAYNEKGIRLMTVFRRNPLTYNSADGITSNPGEPLAELYDSSNATNAVVRACAFKLDETNWTCGVNKCCTTVDEQGVTKATEPDEHGNCVLSYGITGADTMTRTVVQGIQALVKYGTYEVSTRVRVADGEDYGQLDPTCLIDRIEAFEYHAPEAEPAKSCNPEAQKTKVKINGEEPDYFNGFENFASGTSTSKGGAELVFNVVAKNDCIEQQDDAQTFKLKVDVINPTTGLVFGTEDVTITVEAKEQNGGDN